jgi:type VI protein secretion system component VasF
VLSDRERATLEEIQRGLVAEDPRFVQAFDARTQALSRTGRASSLEYRLTQTVLLWITVALAVLLLATGAVGGALLLGGIAVALALARDPGGTDPRSRWRLT